MFYRYKGYLPDTLANYHIYYPDCGHCIVCVLESHLEEAQNTDMAMYEIPVPVKYVIEKGYRIVNNHVIVEAPYDDFLGVQVDEKYTEF